jgi:hypothetical protein
MRYSVFVHPLLCIALTQLRDCKPGFAQALIILRMEKSMWRDIGAHQVVGGPEEGLARHAPLGCCRSQRRLQSIRISSKTSLPSLIASNCFSG